MRGKNRVMMFTIAGDEMDRLEDFLREHRDCAEDVFGGRYSFSFFPCEHGMLKEVTCICGKTLYLEPETHVGGDENFEDLFRE